MKIKMLTTYTLDTLLAKFEVGAKPRARDPPATPRRERWRRRRSRVYLRGRGWGTRACGYEKGLGIEDR